MYALYLRFIHYLRFIPTFCTSIRQYQLRVYMPVQSNLLQQLLILHGPRRIVRRLITKSYDIISLNQALSEIAKNVVTLP